jgi:hypothetical protein
VTLTDVYVQTPNQFADFFRQIRQGQAPKQFTIQHLKDLGFTSTNHRAFIPLLKALGFLSADGQPTQRYHDYRNESQARQVMGQALKEAYADLFVLRAHPSDADRPLLEGKFKSAHNVSDRVARLMASTFYALLPLADLSGATLQKQATAGEEKTDATKRDEEHFGSDEERPPAKAMRRGPTNLHYNIQIHLPATKDIEVFNAIFKSLKEHLID